MPDRGLSMRSVLLGLVGGALICLFVPYNDLAMQNTPLVGNNLPMSVMVLLLGFVVLINGPLSRFKPHLAFSGYELAVTLTILLAMCSIPSTGLMRYLLPNLAAPWAYGVDNPGYRSVLERLDIAAWVFPQFEGATPADWIGDPLATGFVDRWTQPDRSPYAAWVTPFLAWGLFVALLSWSMLCLACLVFTQWRHHEHLPFPLVNIQLALVEAPKPRRWLNRILSSRAFWIAFFAVLLLHLWNGMARYHPKYFEPIARGFDLMDVLNEKPWSYSDGNLRRSTVYFTMVGIAYFLSGPVAFSLWFFVILMQGLMMIRGSLTGEPAILGLDEQRHGAALAFFLSLLWLGRRHIRLIASQFIRGRRAGEERGNYLSYRAAAWGWLVTTVGLLVWLIAAGASFLTALNVVVMLNIGFTLITRLIAETGIIHGAMPVSLMKPLQMASIYLNAKPPLDGTYLNALSQATYYDYREVLPVNVTHGMAALDETRPDTRTRDWARDGRRLIGWAFVGVMLAYAISFWSSLWVNYTYAVTLDINQTSPIDLWGIRDNPRLQLLNSAVAFDKEEFVVPYERLNYLGLGFAVTAILSVLRFTFAWWPLHPVGYLIYGTFPSTVMWFSIFLGWAIKQIVLRLGGAKMYEALKPVFIGLILGEVAAGGAWGLISITLHALGLPYRSILVLPQ